MLPTELGQGAALQHRTSSPGPIWGPLSLADTSVTTPPCLYQLQRCKWPITTTSLITSTQHLVGLLFLPALCVP